MHDSNQQELFSRAYVMAVISAAGCNLLKPEIDRYSIDFVIQGDIGLNPYPKINVQLKSTTVGRVSGGHLKYRLDRTTYDHLRRPSSTPFLLVVVALPRDVRRWASCSEQSILLRRCAYWYSLAGAQPIQTESTTLYIPLTQRFTVEYLEATMRALEGEGAA